MSTPVVVAVDGRSDAPLDYALQHYDAETPVALVLATPSTPEKHLNPFVYEPTQQQQVAVKHTESYNKEMEQRSARVMDYYLNRCNERCAICFFFSTFVFASPS